MTAPEPLPAEALKPFKAVRLTLYRSNLEFAWGRVRGPCEQ